MAPAQPKPREGLRISTLVIAAIASGAAALIVSHFWARGTIIASAMTPVFVALVSELLRKPVESEIVRKPLRVARSAVTSNVPVTFERRGSDNRPLDADGAAAQDVRIYSSGSNRTRTKPRRNLRVKVAVITGLVAFLIAAAFLTLPEVIFGGSVAGGHRSTTYFGGSSSSSSSTKSDSSDKSSSKDSKSSDSSKDSTNQSSTGNQTTTDQTTTTAPDQTTTNQTTTQQQTAPAPSTTTPAPPTQPVPVTPTPTTPTP